MTPSDINSAGGSNDTSLFKLKMTRKHPLPPPSPISLKFLDLSKTVHFRYTRCKQTDQPTPQLFFWNTGVQTDTDRPSQASTVFLVYRSTDRPSQASTVFLEYRSTDRQTDTDRQTQTDRQTDRLTNPTLQCFCLPKMSA